MVLGRIALTFIVLMIIEMFLLIEIGGSLGALTTIALVFITAAVGIWMMRLQGAATLRRAQLAANQGVAPVREAAEGMILLFGGVLLLIPGFFTDFIGLLCLLPPTRALLLRRFAAKAAAGSARAQAFGRVVRPGAAPRGGRLIEGDWKDDRDDR